jgi:hypothetical protein
MNMLRTLLLLMAVLLLGGAPSAQEKPTYNSLLEALQKAGCAPADHADFILMTCSKEKSLWYFSKPNHPAHPGVLQRAVVQKGNDFYIETKGWSFGGAEAQPAFQRWLAQMKELDEQVRKSLQKK